MLAPYCYSLAIFRLLYAPQLPIEQPEIIVFFVLLSVFLSFEENMMLQSLNIVFRQLNASLSSIS